MHSQTHTNSFYLRIQHILCDSIREHTLSLEKTIVTIELAHKLISINNTFSTRTGHTLWQLKWSQSNDLH